MEYEGLSQVVYFPAGNKAYEKTGDTVRYDKTDA